jgi:hypothetical protein
MVAIAMRPTIAGTLSRRTSTGEDLVAEVSDAGFQNIQAFGIEGPGWLVPDFDARWNDAEARKRMLDVARLLEHERSIIGMSPHVLVVGVYPPLIPEGAGRRLC